jgi:hypothetical protein
MNQDCQQCLYISQAIIIWFISFLWIPFYVLSSHYHVGKRLHKAPGLYSLRCTLGWSVEYGLFPHHSHSTATSDLMLLLPGYDRSSNFDFASSKMQCTHLFINYAKGLEKNIKTVYHKLLCQWMVPMPFLYKCHHSGFNVTNFMFLMLRWIQYHAYHQGECPSGYYVCNI